MRLLVVYGLKTRDQSWFGQFYPSRRLSEECANRSIPLRFLFPCEVPSFIEESRAESSGSRSTVQCGFPPERTVCLIRGEVSEETYRLLEAAGFRCVNQWTAVALARDKLETARFLERHGWPTPETVSARDALPVRFPLVLKPRCGSRGVGVTLIESEHELARWKEGNSSPSAGKIGNPETGDFVLQEYIASSRGKDVRFFFAGGEILAVAERHAAGNSFISNASSGGSMCVPSGSVPSWSGYWARMALDIAKEAGLWYGTVDFLYLEEARDDLGCTGPQEPELTVCEINSSPGFEALETDLGCNIAGMLLDHLMADFG